MRIPFLSKSAPRTKADAAKDKVAEIKEAIRFALQIREGDEDSWREFLAVYHLEPRNIMPEAIAAYHSHKGHQFVSKMVSLLTFRDPKWQVLASNSVPGVKDTASIISNWMSWFMYHNDIREDVLEGYILDLLITGTGVLESGYKESPREKPQGAQDAVEMAQKLELMGQAMAMGGEVPADMLAMASEEVGKELVPPPPEDDAERRTNDMPFVQHVDTFDFIIAPGYTTLEQAWVGGGWCAKRMVYPMTKIKANKELKNKDLIEPVREIKNPRYEPLIDGQGKDNKCQIELAELWVYWEAPQSDDDPGHVYIVSEDSDKEHWKNENPYPELNGFPFRALSFKRKKGQFWGIPYLKHLMEGIDAYDQMRSFHQDIARMKKPLLAALAGGVSDAEVDNIANAPAGTVIKMNMLDAVRPLDFGTAPVELTNEIRLLSSDIEVGSGIGANQIGGFGTPGASATEVSTIQQNIMSDIQFIASKASNALAKVGRDVVKLLQSRGDPEREIRIAGVDGKEWVNFRLEDIKGDFDLRVGVGMEMPIDQAVRQRMLIDILQLAQGFPGQFRMNKLGRDIMELMALPNPDQYIVDKDGREQHLETLAMLLTGEDVEVIASDEHLRHRNDVARAGGAIVELLNSGTLSPETGQRMQILMQNLQQHDQAHALFLGERPGNQVPQAKAGGPTTRADMIEGAAGGGAGL